MVLASILGPPALSAQEVDLDGRVRVQFSPLRFIPSERLYLTSATMTNTSADVLLAPMSLVVTSFPPGVQLANSAGRYVINNTSYPFVSVPLTGGLLGPGQNVTGIDLKFSNPNNLRIQFTTTLRGGVSVVETVLQTSGSLVGVAVASDGTAYVSNALQGEIFKVPPTGPAVVVASGLSRPRGLALLGADLLIAEEGNDRVLRLTPAGALSVFASGIRTPRWLAVAHDGTVYVTAHRLTGTDGSDPLEGKVIIRRDPATALLSVVAANIRKLGATALNGSALFAAAQRQESLPIATGVILRYPLLSGGTLGSPTYSVSTALTQPEGLVLDPLAALYTTASAFSAGGGTLLHSIVKVHPDAHTVAFAAPLADPRGLALGPDGSLYVADGASGRLVRFRAPAPPTLDPLPPAAGQSPITVSGTTVPSARVDIFVDDATPATTGQSTSAGIFSLQVPLVLNSLNTLEVFATARLGDGLTGAPAAATITHDNQPPTVAFLAPPANAYVRQTVSVQARADGGGGSPVAGVALSTGGQSLSAALSPAPPAPSVTATASWNTAAVPDGAQTLTATASDQAGNSAGATRAVLVDNTPPDTQITAGPGGTITDTSTTFTVSGRDNLTPVAQLQYAWRLDGGAYSAFGPATQIPLSGLTPGAHLFEVKARDLVGNEDPTPTQQAFTVSTLSVQITTPAAGAMVQAGLALVRGTVSAGGADVGVTVNGRPASVQGSAFAAQVAVDPSTTQLVAVATTATGATTSSTIALSVTGSPTDAVILRSNPQSGIAPLQVTFSVSSPRPIAQVALDVDGNGSVDFQGGTLDGQPFTFAQPGLYVASVVVTDSQGVQSTAASIIQVFDRAQLDALLQGKWTALRDALGRADVAGAVSLFAQASRDAYQDQLGALAGVGALGQVASDLGPIRLVRTRANAAEYEVRAVRNAVEYSFHVPFIVDDDGVWRLRGF